MSIFKKYILPSLLILVYVYGLIFLGMHSNHSKDISKKENDTASANEIYDLKGKWKIKKIITIPENFPLRPDSTWMEINRPDDLPDQYKGEMIALYYQFSSSDSVLFKFPVYLNLSQKGATILYLNNFKVFQEGIPSNNAAEETAVVSSKSVLINISNQLQLSIIHSELNPYQLTEITEGIRLSFSRYPLNSKNEYPNIITLTALVVFLITLAFIHLLLFFFYPAIKENLYFFFFLLFYSLIWLLMLFNTSSHWLLHRMASEWIHSVVVLCLSSLIFLAEKIFRQKLSKYLWALFALILFISLADTFFKITLFENIKIILTIWLALFSIFFIFVSVWKSRKSNLPGIKIISFGMFIFGVFLFLLLSIGFYMLGRTTASANHSVNVSLNLSLTGNNILSAVIILLLLLSLISIPLSFSIYLAYQFSDINKNLKQQLEEIQKLTEKTIQQEKEKQEILQKQNELLELQVKERTQEILNQKQTIEQKNKDILDSINYASRIQKALITPNHYIQHHFISENFFKEYFTLYLPKDIVSGDFYWANVNFQNAGCPHYLAVCDCTGHGVPGAFMSLLNINYLTEAVQERQLYFPNDILNYVRKKLIDNLSYDEQQKDGMDASIIMMDKRFPRTKKLYYALANHLLVIVRETEVVLLQGDKMPVGKGHYTEEFRLFQYDLKEDDRVYLFTDGYKDQFGGEKGKRIMQKQFIQLLKESSGMRMQEQKKFLEDFFIGWKKENEQTDDVCIVGFRV